MKKTDNWKKAMEVRKKRKMKSIELKKERSVSPITRKRIVRYVLKKAKNPRVTDMKIALNPHVCIFGEYIWVIISTNTGDCKKYTLWRRARERDGATLAIEVALKNNGIPVKAIAEGRQGLVICDLLD